MPFGINFEAFGMKRPNEGPRKGPTKPTKPRVLEDVEVRSTEGPKAFETPKATGKTRGDDLRALPTSSTVLRGFFDKITGLTVVTERHWQALPDGAAAQFEVVKSGPHIYQLKTDALKCLNFTDDEIYSLVVPKRTLARRVASDEPLSVEESDKAVRLGRIDKLAVDVFGDASKAHRWLRKPKKSLGGETPLAYLASEVGARAVEEMLNQIDHGIGP